MEIPHHRLTRVWGRHLADFVVVASENWAVDTSAQWIAKEQTSATQ
jgi:hypothetical protein